MKSIARLEYVSVTDSSLSSLSYQDGYPVLRFLFVRLQQFRIMSFPWFSFSSTEKVTSGQRLWLRYLGLWPPRSSQRASGEVMRQLRQMIIDRQPGHMSVIHQRLSHVAVIQRIESNRSVGLRSSLRSSWEFAWWGSLNFRPNKDLAFT